jgi:SAM-dependent methyltransferase
VSAPADRRQCPLCAGREHAPFAGRRREGNDYSIVRCAKCRFVFVANPTRQTFHPVQVAPTRVPELARHRQIKRLCDGIFARGARGESPRRIVEVGAGWGGLAQVFSRDPRYRYLGFEPSAARASHCRQLGFDVREATFNGEDVGGPLDAVIIDNVLEHVLDPDALIGASVSSLRAGGVLVVIVPNLRDIRRFHPRWRERHYWQPHCHINYFSSRDVDRLFSKHGISCRTFGLRTMGLGTGDLALLPRVVADMAGVNLFGLNCYGVKSGS